MLGHVDLVAVRVLSRVSHHTGQGRYRRYLGGYEINLSILGSASAEEVTVEGSQRNALGVRRLTHADAGAACALEDSCAGVDQIGQRAVLRQHVEHLLGAGSNRQRYAVGNRLAFQNMRDLHQIGVARVGAGADTYLIDFHACQFFNGLHCVGGVGASRQRCQLRKVDYDVLVIDSVVIRLELGICVRSVLRLQEFERVLVRGEDRGGRAQLSAHVGDGRSLRDAQCLDTLAGILNDLAYAALDGHDAQHFKDDILCGDILLQLAL